MSVEKSDFLVIGSGIAGLFFALKASRLGTVTVLAKGSAMSGSTPMAQGGIASVTEADDSFGDHVRDTLVAGAGLCHEDIVTMCVNQAPQRIQELIDYGVKFDKFGSEFDLKLEGGHSHRRILHSFDQTGIAIQTALLTAVKQNSKIKIIEYQMAIDLILTNRLNPLPIGKQHCVGAYILDSETERVKTFLSPVTVLATGGAGKVYLYTSNWDGATGDGVAMAQRAGAKIANMEFFQFHPTCLYHPSARNFLITEALRGDGAKLRLINGELFAKKYHPDGELAPRDIVARAIDSEMKKTGHDCVYLDATHLSEHDLKTRYPNIFEKCKRLGIDLSREPIPVVPAAHYMCGGIQTDQNGLTNISGLFAIGETAFTGLHGANRLASNSLMEATVFAHNAVEYIETNYKEFEEIKTTVPEWDIGKAVPADEMVLISHTWDEIRRLMWNYVGIVRSTGRLERAKSRIQVIRKEIQDYYWNYTVTKDILELRNLAVAAELVIESALRRKESRGIHFMLDFPNADPEMAHDTVL